MVSSGLTARSVYNRNYHAQASQNCESTSSPHVKIQAMVPDSEPLYNAQAASDLQKSNLSNRS